MTNRLKRATKMLPAPMPDEALDLSYFAGFLDGEGCINITHPRTRRTGPPQFRMQVIIWNTNRAIVEYLAERWTGGFHAGQARRTNATEKGRPCYLVWWHGDLAAALLTRVEPYVRVKHAQLLNALEFQRVKQRRVGRATPPELLQEMARLHEIGRLLNLHEAPPPAPVATILEARALQLEMLELAS